MKFKQIIACSALLMASSAFANTSTYVYCGLPDGSNWDWLLDGNNNYETIEGQWARINQANGTSYLIDGYKTYYNSGTNSAEDNFQLRV